MITILSSTAGFLCAARRESNLHSQPAPFGRLWKGGPKTVVFWRKGGGILKVNSHSGIIFSSDFCVFWGVDQKLLSSARKFHPEADRQAGDGASLSTRLFFTHRPWDAFDFAGSISCFSCSLTQPSAPPLSPGVPPKDSEQ